MNAYPAPASEMPAVFDYHCSVEDVDIDVAGHANNVVFLRWMQSAALAHSAAQGWPTEAYLRLGSGWVVRTHFIEYQRPAFAGDRVIVRTWVADLKKATSLRKYKLLRHSAEGEVVLALAETAWAFINFKSGLPRRIPPEVACAFEIVANASC